LLCDEKTECFGDFDDRLPLAIISVKKSGGIEKIDGSNVMSPSELVDENYVS
jgi:hypothetical protein